MEYFLNSNIEPFLAFITGLDMHFCVRIDFSSPVWFEDFPGCSVSSLMARFLMQSYQNSFLGPFVADCPSGGFLLGIAAHQFTPNYMILCGIQLEETFSSQGYASGYSQGLQVFDYPAVVFVILA